MVQPTAAMLQTLAVKNIALPGRPADH